MPDAPWPSLKAFILDLDGVVYRGETPIPEAVDVIRRWHERGTPFRFVTNNASRSRTELAAKLQRMNVPATEAHVVGSAFATGAWLKKQYPAGTPVHAVGGPGLRAELEAAGFEVVGSGAPVVVAGLDRAFTYEKLRLAVRDILAGADFVATNADPLYPVEDGFDPGGGALVAAIAKAVEGKTTPVVVGKPAPHMLEVARESMGFAAAQTAMIGDQVATDMEAARQAGIFRILVKTGVPLREGDEAQADRVIESFLELPD